MHFSCLFLKGIFMNGKGDSPRPKSVSDKTFSENWNKIFSSKKTKKTKKTKKNQT